MIDRSKTGKIVAGELKHALRSIGDKMTDDEVCTPHFFQHKFSSQLTCYVAQISGLFEEIGVDKDGMINFNEFVKVMARKS